MGLPNELRISRRERVVSHSKIAAISRAKRSDACACSAAADKYIELLIAYTESLQQVSAHSSYECTKPILVAPVDYSRLCDPLTKSANRKAVQ